MTETKEESPLPTGELTTEEARTLVVSLAADIKRRTAHAAVHKRAAIETELKSLQAVYDKVAAAEKAAADASRSVAGYVEMLWPTIFESRVTYLKK